MPTLTALRFRRRHANAHQSQVGDEWHLIAAIALHPADAPYLWLVCAGPCIADALHIRSAARYNDGSPAATVTLAPLDGLYCNGGPRSIYRWSCLRNKKNRAD